MSDIMPLLGGLNPGPQQAQQRQIASQLEIQQALDLAKALEQGSNAQGQRITSPWQVIGNMAEALGGRLQMERAREMQLGRDAAFASAIAPGGPSPGGTTGAAGQTADLSYGSGIVPMDVAREAIAGNEADARGYGTVGPVVPATHDHPSGRALGRYQVMSYDLPNRLSAAGLPPMSEQEWLNNPAAQDRQFDHEFGGYQQRYGNFNDAASVWFSGRPLAQAGNASDGYTTAPTYVAKANATIARLTGAQPGAGGSPLAFSGQPISDRIAGTINALAGRPIIPTGSPAGAPGPAAGTGQPGAPANAPQPSAGALPPGAIGMGPYGPMYVDPRRVPRQPSLTPDQFRSLYVGADPQQQQMLMGIVQRQNQEIGVPVTGGTVYVHPQDPRIQRFESGLEKGTIRVGGDEYPAYTTLSPTGVPTTRIGVPFGPGGPGAGGAVPGGTAPAASPAGPRPPGAPTAAAPAQGGLAPPPANPSVTDLQNFSAAAAANRAGQVKGAEAAATLQPDIAGRQTAVESERRSATEAAGKVGAAVGENQADYIRGFKPAREAIGNLDMMADAVRSAGDNLSAGPVGPAINSVKQFITQVTGRDVPGTTEAQILEKGGTMLAIHTAKELTNRPTQFDFKSIMEKANPNLFQTKAGIKYLIDIDRQQQIQNMDLARLGESTPVSEWPEKRDQYYKTHPLKSPLTGAEWTRDVAAYDANMLSTPHAAGQQGGAGQAEPVAVNSPQEAMKLTPGTKIRLPDGRIGTVPPR